MGGEEHQTSIKMQQKQLEDLERLKIESFTFLGGDYCNTKQNIALNESL